MALRQSDIISLAGQEGVPPELALAIYQQESSSGLNTESGGKNIGGFQVSLDTFNQMNPGGDINNERDNAVAGIRYLKQGLDTTGGDIAQTAAYYHAGPKYLEKLQKNPNLADTKGKTTLSYMNDVVNKTSAFQTTLEGSQAQAPSFSTYDPLGPKGVAGSDRLLPTKVDPMQAIEDMFTQMQTIGKAVQKGYEGFVTDTDAYTQSVTELTNNIAINAEAKGVTDANVVRAQSAANTAKASEAARVLSTSGTDTSDMMSMAADTLSRMRGFKDRATELRSQIQANQVGFLEDPIKWVENHFANEDRARRHNQAIANYETEKRQLDGIIGSASALNEAQNAKRATISAEAAEGTAVSLELGGKLKADEARLVSLDHNQNKRVAAMQQLDRQYTLAEAGARALLASENVKEQMAGKALQADARRLELEKLNLGLGSIGLHIDSIEEYQKAPGRIKEVYNYLSSTGRFGPDFKGSMETVQLGNPSQMPSSTKSILPFSFLLADAGNTEANKTQNQSLSKEERRNLINKTANDEATKWQNDVYRSTDKVANPYLAPDVKTMLSDVNVRQLKIGQLLDRTVKENPGLPIDDKMIAELVRSSFTKGDTYTSIQEAANDLVLYYKSAVAHNNKAHNFYGMNIAEQDRYRFSPGKGKVVDFTNYKDVMLYLAKRAVLDITEAQPTFESIVP